MEQWRRYQVSENSRLPFSRTYRIVFLIRTRDKVKTIYQANGYNWICTHSFRAQLSTKQSRAETTTNNLVYKHINTLWWIHTDQYNHAESTSLTSSTRHTRLEFLAQNSLPIVVVVLFAMFAQCVCVCAHINYKTIISVWRPPMFSWCLHLFACCSIQLKCHLSYMIAYDFIELWFWSMYQYNNSNSNSSE